MTIRQSRMYSEFLKEHEAEERQKRELAEAPIRRMTQQLSRTHSELIAAENQLACQELMNEPNNTELAKRTTEFNPANYSSNGVEKSAEEMQSMIRDAFLKAKMNIEAKGYRLQPAFDEKVKRIVMNNRSVDVCRSETFETLFAYGEEIGLWSDREITRPVQPTIVAHVEQERTLQDVQQELEGQESLSREGRLRAKVLATEALCLEAKPIATEFFNFLATTYGKTYTPEERQSVVTWLRDQNLSMSNPSSWNRARREYLKCVTEEEEQSILMDQDDTLTAREFAKKYRVNRGSATIGL